MEIVGTALIAIAALLGFVLQAAWWVLVARIVLSWAGPGARGAWYTPLVDGINRVTDPPLSAARRALPFLVLGQLDLSPLAVFMALGFVQSVVPSTLAGLGASLL